jgi:serine/threonine protein phosphatase PrpC
MVYLSCNHKGLRKNQDRTGVSITSDDQRLIICDGIGSYSGSGEIAELVVRSFRDNRTADIREIIAGVDESNLTALEEPGGTTVITGNIKTTDSGPVARLEYLGNGGCVHLSGNFAADLSNGIPFRYHHVILPHVNSERALIRHFSKGSSAKLPPPGRIDLSLNHSYGDILVFFSDGVTTLEDEGVVEDGQGRYWKIQSRTLITVLQKLHELLSSLTSPDDMAAVLAAFNEDLVNDLVANETVDDDVSIGFIITDTVLDHYAKRLPAL